MKATISIHLNKVDSSVESTRKLGIINIHCEFFILELEHVILVTRLIQQEQSGANVGGVLPYGHKLE